MPVADSDMVVDNGHGLYEGKIPNSAGNESILPASLCSPVTDILKNFYHTKRVGNYMIGRKLGEGSFAKVREGLHALTGEKVSGPQQTVYILYIYIFVCVCVSYMSYILFFNLFCDVMTCHLELTVSLTLIVHCLFVILMNFLFNFDCASPFIASVVVLNYISMDRIRCHACLATHSFRLHVNSGKSCLYCDAIRQSRTS